MAEILIKGRVATVEIEQDDDGGIVATCIEHRGYDLLVPTGCGWTWSESNDWNDVMCMPDIERHADKGN